MEVVEAMKEGYESDVLDPESSNDQADTPKSASAASDEEEETGSKKGSNDSDEDYCNTTIDMDMELEEVQAIR